MITQLRTDSGHADFKTLVEALDAELRIRDGDDFAFYAQLNRTDLMKQVLIAYEGSVAAACGALRDYQPGTVEIKRMYVIPSKRNRGIASRLLRSLEEWAAELGYSRCILETGRNQPEAIRLYQKNGYQEIPNYGKYQQVSQSICFRKDLDGVRATEPAP